MIKISTIFVLGIFVVLIQFTGFPIQWKDFFYIISGLVIALFSVLIRRELHEVLRHLHGDTIKTDSFFESAPKQDE